MMRIRIGWIILMLLAAPLMVYAQSKPLPEIYVSDDEVTTFHYPASWEIDAEQPGLVIVSTSDQLSQLGSDTLSLGDAVVVILFSNADDSYLREYFQGDTPGKILDHFAQEVMTPYIDGNIEFTSPYPVQFADFSAVRSDAIYRGNTFFLIVADRGNGLYSLTIGISASSDSAKFEPKLLAIAESVNYHPRSQ